jgi:23S rRNA (uracil1939-C5)-methyltransferase
MEIKNNPKLVEIDIVDLAFDGKSVGHLDGKVCFLKGGLPGEKVLAEITREKRRFNNGIVREIIKKSDKRIDAVCSHFGHCGGCTWQDLNYSDQLSYKQKQVNDCIERIGGLENVKIHDIIGSENVFRYRNKMEYSFHKAEDDEFTLGLHVRGEFDNIFNLNECHITSEHDADIVKWFREYIKQNNIDVYDVKNHGGYMRFLMLRSTSNTSQLMVNIVTNYGDFPNTDKLIDELTSTFPQITTLVHNQNGQKSNIAVGEIENILFGPGYIEEKLFESTFRIRANSFFQTNSHQAQKLYQTGFDMLKPDATSNILDLYCGTGSIGILIAPLVSAVVGVELVADAVSSAKENASINNTSNISFYEGFVKDFLKENNKTDRYFDIVIVDPPRAGLNPKALKELIKLKPQKILYISCNPATFARDAKTLVESGYNLPELKPIDMFPHTMHIELASVFYLE